MKISQFVIEFSCPVKPLKVVGTLKMSFLGDVLVVAEEVDSLASSWKNHKVIVFDLK